MMEVISCGTPILYARQVAENENIWLRICESLKIPADYTLIRNCDERSKNTPIDVRSTFLDTWRINKESPFHISLLERAKTETLTYGTMPGYMWFLFFSSLSKGRTGGYPIELRYISGIVSWVKKQEGVPPVVIRKRDFSELKYVSGFYNMNNIIECMLNISEIRMSLSRNNIRVNGKYHSLYSILDEVALRIGVSPKIVVKNIRTACTMVVRRAGSLSDNPHYVRHMSGNPLESRLVSDLVIQKIDHDFYKKFSDSMFAKRSIEDGLKTMKDHKLYKLHDLANDYLHCNFGDESNTSVDDFAFVGSFILNLVKVAGYGRAQLSIAAPRSFEAKSDYGDLPYKIEEILMSFHRMAIEKGIMPTTTETFYPRCISYWKSTSAGVKPSKVDVSVNDREYKNVRVGKKLGVGVVCGKDLFTRDTLSRKLTRENPGNVGARDVPYKATRAVYVIPLPTLHAQVAVAHHLAVYVSSTDNRSPLATDGPHCDHISAGSSSTSGVRVVDTGYTILNSGTDKVITIDIDATSFDSSLVWGNFRKPILRALRRMSWDGAVFGPDKIDKDEMIDYAFGEGSVYGTYWDAGRVPIVYLDNDSDLKELSSRYKFEEIVISDIEYKLKRIPGLKSLKAGTYYMTCDPIHPKDESKFKVSFRMDGEDLIFLTSEASGELTTLAFNSAASLAMIDIILARTHEKNLKFRECLKPITKRAIGDDVTIAMKIVSDDFTSEDIDDFLMEVSSIVRNCGLEMSVPKTHITIHSSEYIQTHATLGVYIPKDHIMLIASERPRSITDSVQFMESLRRLLCTKVSRGYEESAAIAILLYISRWISRLDSRFLNLKIGAPERILSGETQGFEMRIRNVDILKNKKENSDKKKKDKKDKNAFWEFTWSSMLCLFPRSCGGIGLSLIALSVVHTDALFLRELSKMGKIEKNKFLVLYAYLIKLIEGFNPDENMDIRISESPNLDCETLYSRRVNERINALKGAFTLGTHNAENVPRKMFKDGLALESFMTSVRHCAREMLLLHIIKNLKQTRADLKFNHDEWLLGFVYTYGNPIPLNNRLTFINGMSAKTTLIIRAFGINNEMSTRFTQTERLRIIISKDPARRSNCSPAEVTSVLDKYDVNTMLDADKGRVILWRMGFENSVCEEILNHRFSNAAVKIQDDSMGALRDDLISMTGMITQSSFNDFMTAGIINSGMRFQCFIFSRQIMLLDFLRTGTLRIVESAERNRTLVDLVNSRAPSKLINAKSNEGFLYSCALPNFNVTVRQLKSDIHVANAAVALLSDLTA
nr:TPA_asm: VP1 [Aedes orbi-like virus]